VTNDELLKALKKCVSYLDKYLESYPHVAGTEAKEARDTARDVIAKAEEEG